MLPKSSKIAILIPVYNEAKHLGTLIEKLKGVNLPIYFVNDGSTDDSLDVLYSYNVKYFTYSKNKGKGFAVKYGANHLIFDKKVDYILIMDSDLQNAIIDIPLFIKAQKYYPNAKIIIGNRLCKPTGMPIVRFLTNKIMSWLISIFAGQKIHDSQCGFRLLHKDVFDLELKEDRFALESEALIKAGKRGYKIENVPIQCIYDKNRVSKIRPIRDAILFFKMLWRVR